MANTKNTTAILLVYYKDGVVKTLDTGSDKTEHDKMIADGWIHTATLNAGVFVEQLYNEVPDEELRNTIKSLTRK